MVWCIIPRILSVHFITQTHIILYLLAPLPLSLVSTPSALSSLYPPLTETVQGRSEGDPLKALDIHRHAPPIIQLLYMIGIKWKLILYSISADICEGLSNHQVHHD